MLGKHTAPHPFVPRLDTYPGCPPTRLITYMRGVGLGGSCSLEHGWLKVMEARVETRHPLGSARGSRSVGSHKPFPSLQGGGGGVYRQRGGGLWLGLSLSHFLLLWVLPLPPLTHLPLLLPTLLPTGQGLLSGIMCRGLRHSRPESPAGPDPVWGGGWGRSGEGGPGRAGAKTRCPGLTPNRC